jgi:hypothetical protein
VDSNDNHQVLFVPECSIIKNHLEIIELFNLIELTVRLWAIDDDGYWRVIAGWLTDGVDSK